MCKQVTVLHVVPFSDWELDRFAPVMHLAALAIVEHEIL